MIDQSIVRLHHDLPFRVRISAPAERYGGGVERLYYLANALSSCPLGRAVRRIVEPARNPQEGVIRVRQIETSQQMLATSVKLVKSLIAHSPFCGSSAIHRLDERISCILDFVIE